MTNSRDPVAGAGSGAGGGDGAESGNERLRESVAAEIEAALDDHWLALQHECDLNLLAAYAEDSLPRATRERVALLIATNPYAQAVVESVRQRLASEPASTMGARGTTTTSTTPTEPRLSQPSDQPSVRGRADRDSTRKWRYLIAASLLVATAALFWGWHGAGERGRLQDQVAQLDARWKDSLQRESQVAKSLLASQTAQREPVYLVGASSPSLLAAALTEPTRVRGPEDETPDERATLDRLAHAARQAADQQARALRQDDAHRRLEHASVSLLAGLLDEADRELRDLEREPRGVDSGAVSNARGVWHLVRARRADTRKEEKDSLEAARQSLVKAAEQGEPNAWLNLAILLLDQRETSEAKKAAVRYLESTRLAPEAARQVSTRFALDSQ